MNEELSDKSRLDNILEQIEELAKVNIIRLYYTLQDKIDEYKEENPNGFSSIKYYIKNKDEVIKKIMITTRKRNLLREAGIRSPARPRPRND